jgi:aspartate/glutamate racemase
MIVEGQKRYYGEALGIARFDQIHRHPAIPGDVENASTYPFPVRMKVIEGLYDNPYPPVTDNLGNYNPEVQKTIGAVKDLAADGVRAIVMACGYFSLVQDILTEEVDVPVFTSPLLFVPVISRMIGRKRKVGIVAASKNTLTDAFLRPVGIDASIPHIIEGLDDSTEFNSCFMGGLKTTLDVDLLQGQVLRIISSFVKRNPDIGALLLECSALPPFSAVIQREVDLPVFDYITFIHCVYSAVVQQEYLGIM